VDFPEDRVLNVSPRRLLDFLEQRSGKHIAELADF
jgi:putative hydrolase